MTFLFQPFLVFWAIFFIASYQMLLSSCVRSASQKSSTFILTRPLRNRTIIIMTLMRKRQSHMPVFYSRFYLTLRSSNRKERLFVSSKLLCLFDRIPRLLWNYGFTTRQKPVNFSLFRVIVCVPYIVSGLFLSFSCSFFVLRYWWVSQVFTPRISHIYTLSLQTLS